MNKYKFKLNKKSQRSTDFFSLVRFLLTGLVNISTQVLSQNSPKRLWKPLSKIKEFQFLFPQNQDVSWTLLKKQKEDFIQTKPYSQQGLQWLLKEGLISDQDFIWKEGDDSWNRISLSSYFHTPVETAMEDLMDKISITKPSWKDSKNSKDSKVFIYQRPEPKIF